MSAINWDDFYAEIPPPDDSFELVEPRDPAEEFSVLFRRGMELVSRGPRRSEIYCPHEAFRIRQANPMPKPYVVAYPKAFPYGYSRHQSAYRVHLVHHLHMRREGELLVPEQVFWSCSGGHQGVGGASVQSKSFEDRVRLMAHPDDAHAYRDDFWRQPIECLLCWSKPAPRWATYPEED